MLITKLTRGVRSMRHRLHLHGAVVSTRCSTHRLCTIKWILSQLKLDMHYHCPLWFVLLVCSHRFGVWEGYILLFIKWPKFFLQKWGGGGGGRKGTPFLSAKRIRLWTMALVYVFAQPQSLQRNVGNLERNHPIKMLLSSCSKDHEKRHILVMMRCQLPIGSHRQCQHFFWHYLAS